MHTTAPHSKVVKKTGRKLRPVWLLGLMLLLVVGWFVLQLVLPGPKIVISRQTTYITEPLAADGLPDFEAYLYQLESEGATFENNAAVLILRATWPGDIEPQYHRAMCDALGIQKIPTTKGTLVPVAGDATRQRVADWLADQFPERDKRDTDSLAWKTIDEALARPWTSKQLPPLAEWVKENQQPLDLSVEASKRSHYFAPSPSYFDGKNEELFAILLPHMQNLRLVDQALSMRAMWHLGEGRLDEAWQDIAACHRLAERASNGWFLVHQLVSIAMGQIADDLTVALLQHDDLSIDLANDILKTLKKKPRFPFMVTAMESGARFAIIDMVLGMATGRNNAMDMDMDTDIQKIPMGLTTTDWNFVLQEINTLVDQMVAAAKIKKHVERIAALEVLDQQLSDRASRVHNPSVRIKAFLNRELRSRTMADVLIGLIMPVISAACSAEDRSHAHSDLTLIAAALAVYRARHGEYPETLDQLAPKVLPSVPLDLYSGQPPIYQRKGEGYLLYSIFENGVDDLGNDYRNNIALGEWVEDEKDYIPHDAESDMVIRVPEPGFRLPVEK